MKPTTDSYRVAPDDRRLHRLIPSLQTDPTTGNRSGGSAQNKPSNNTAPRDGVDEDDAYSINIPKFQGKDGKDIHWE